MFLWGVSLECFSGVCHWGVSLECHWGVSLGWSVLCWYCAAYPIADGKLRGFVLAMLHESIDELRKTLQQLLEALHGAFLLEIRLASNSERIVVCTQESFGAEGGANPCVEDAA